MPSAGKLTTAFKAVMVRCGMGCRVGIMTRKSPLTLLLTLRLLENTARTLSVQGMARTDENSLNNTCIY